MRHSKYHNERVEVHRQLSHMKQDIVNNQDVKELDFDEYIVQDGIEIDIDKDSIHNILLEQELDDAFTGDL